MTRSAATVVSSRPCDHSHFEREIEDLSQEILERYEEVNVLYRLTESSRDMFEERAVLELTLKETLRAVHGMAGWIAVLDPDGAIVSTMGSGPGASQVSIQAIGPLARRALAEQRVLLRESIAGPDGFPGPTMAVPLRGKVAPIGVLILARGAEAGPFRSGEQLLATTVASYGASVVENRRLLLAMKEAERVKGEIEIARRIQSGLLPDADPSVRGLQVAGICRPAEDIGGDYFGYMHVSPGRFGIVIADVSGHSIGAAIGMVMARCIIQSEAYRSPSPSRIMTRANDQLCRDLTDPGMFVTVFLGVYEEDSGILRYTNAGHNPPLVYRAARKSIERLSGGGPGLGIVPDARYHEAAETLEPDDLVVLYTDGITEARAASGEMFGLERLKQAVAHCHDMGARPAMEEIAQRVTSWRGMPVFADDVTLVVARRE